MSEKDMIRAILVQPGKPAKSIEFEHTLEEMQRLVGGGLIQQIRPFEDDAVLICNDEGKLLGMPLNRAFYDKQGRMYDIIAGDFFICRAPAGSDTYTSLTEEQVKKYTKQFQYPEVFYKMLGRIEVAKIKPRDMIYER